MNWRNTWQYLSSIEIKLNSVAELNEIESCANSLSNIWMISVWNKYRVHTFSNRIYWITYILTLTVLLMTANFIYKKLFGLVSCQINYPKHGIVMSFVLVKVFQTRKIINRSIHWYFWLKCGKSLLKKLRNKLFRAMKWFLLICTINSICRHKTQLLDKSKCNIFHKFRHLW